MTELALSRLSVGAVVVVAGPFSRSSSLAPGMLPTRFGGGAKVLTSFVAIVAKCRGPGPSSSFLPLKGTTVNPVVGGKRTFILCTVHFASLRGSEFICLGFEGIQLLHRRYG